MLHQLQPTASAAVLIEMADRSVRTLGACQREILESLARCDHESVWEPDGCQSMVEWISGRYGISWWMAGRWLRAGHALRALPLLGHALETGRLSMEKVVELVRFATPHAQRDLIEWAERVSLGVVKERAAVLAGRVLDDVKDAERTRSLRHWLDIDGLQVNIFARLPVADGAEVVRAINRMAEQVPPDPELDTDLSDPLDARRADALVAMASRALALDGDRNRSTVVGFVEMGDEGDRAHEIEGSGPVHGETLRRLMCDGRLELVLRNGDGDPVGIGRVSRKVPSWLERQVRHRDRTCTFPGCELRRYTECHHIIHWRDGGPTDLGNLTLVCGFHHKLVHEFGWEVRMDAGGVVRWCRPDSRLFLPRAGVARAPT